MILLGLTFLHISSFKFDHDKAIILLIPPGFMRASRASHCPINAVGVVFYFSLAVCMAYVPPGADVSAYTLF
jgi:hypothetical protein